MGTHTVNSAHDVHFERDCGLPLPDYKDKNLDEFRGGDKYPSTQLPCREDGGWPY